MAKCKKIRYRSGLKPDGSLYEKVLLGLIINQDNFFIYFQTANKNYTIAKNMVVDIEDTDVDYVEGSTNGNL